MALIELKLKKYRQEGDMQHTYAPLKNLLIEDDRISWFNTSELKLNLNHPITMDCQPSYDGTVNLIINDDINPPRLINTRFSRMENNKYKIITRNQSQQTNLYQTTKIDQQTRLIRNINCIPKFKFVDIKTTGQLMGGNYTFYIKYADADGNQTPVVAESGQVAVFHGDYIYPSTVNGTIENERTNKSITLDLLNMDTSFSNFYLYYTREFSDANGIRQTEVKSFIKPYKLYNDTESVCITGYEDVIDITLDELNIVYNSIQSAKTQAQVQNRLFMGNILESTANFDDIQTISYFIDVSLHEKSDSIGYVTEKYEAKSGDDMSQVEYYSPHNIYYNLGYWPDEIYRLGIVYILNDDTCTPVFNLRGCAFDGIGASNLSQNDNLTSELSNKTLIRDSFIENSINFHNTFGVFKNPKHNIYKNEEIKPLHYRIKLSSDVCKKLSEHNIKGYFIVRQKRIPTIISQGLSISIDEASYIPMLKNNSGKYFTEGLIASNGMLTEGKTQRFLHTTNRQGSALLCMDANVTPQLQSQLDGSEFRLEAQTNVSQLEGSNDHFYITKYNTSNWKEMSPTYSSAIFVNSDTPLKYLKDYGFSTRAGSATDVKQFGIFGTKQYGISNSKHPNVIRGIYCPIVGVTTSLNDNCLYDIKIKDYNENHLKDYFEVRGRDTSPFYAISDRYELHSNDQIIDVYRGDCYTNTVTIRLNRNFVDPDVPINEMIVDYSTWKDNYKGMSKTSAEDWGKINRADLNAVPLGMWITFKCLSSYNLGLRSLDRNHPDEEALLGNPRGFYPMQGISYSPSLKTEESWLLNSGYNATVGQLPHTTVPNVPYLNDLFDNRIMFSNTQVDSAFKNNYRIFQGLSYGDVDRQYGAIVKLLPWDTNLFCVFEHGLAIIPINEKALIQTTTGQSVHMYGAGVIQNQVSLISPDFGSIWSESIIQTPIGIYGVDTTAKKIWKFSKQNGLEIISDMRIQRFLNDNIALNESDKYPIIGLLNVKSHYNNYKGDVMFTFYNFKENKEWNLCFNERINKWVTRYSWTPLCSENVNNTFYSLDKKRSEILTHIYNNKQTSYGLLVSNNQWSGSHVNGDFILDDEFKTKIQFTGNSLAKDFKLEIKSVKSSYIDNANNEVSIEIPSHFIHLNSQSNSTELCIRKSELETLESGLPLYYIIQVIITPILNENSIGTRVEKTIGLIVDNRHDEVKFKQLLCNGFYIHGESGIVDEMNHDNKIKPTYWYNKQEPFEFEFVVNEPIGLHKIFNNLIIISNNAEPDSFEFEIVGDAYEFKKSGLYKNADQLPSNFSLKYDHVLNQNTLIVKQDCKNIETYGRRSGNIQYKEDAWYTNIEPIIYDKKEARLRDKFIKIRVKYSGKDQVIITALKTLFTISYS